MKCCELTTGKLRSIIVIEREARVSDNAGGQTITWAQHAAMRAWVKPMSGGERVQAMRLEATVTHRIYTRYKSGLLTSDRISFNGRTFQIRALIDIEERGQWLEILANEGVVT